jgi:Spy/CpxP family protein refolding chaperone
MKIARIALTVAIAMFVTAPLLAMDSTPCTGAKPSQPQTDTVHYQVLEKLGLSSEQKIKLAAIDKVYSSKFAALAEKANEILTAEQKKARDEAVKAAKAAGKKGKELREAAKAALKLTDAQKPKMAEVRKDMAALRKNLRETIATVLTSEQNAQLTKMREEHLSAAEKSSP